ncbi:biotin-dependent carboxyltransferase family protein [Brevibacillus fluminis]|uniref:Biotin-dependent carboxyltransferase family protein n=1 Tax=Brevibacillus fluminis TaxID=511487 RepID=A0A3M8DS20_9BACL|nr:biotin-dependent carboxyltransferase family protein [Brevibacillus fluminis]RNB90289.1 biotin-dependent carboxyltransferase family protein [Brevibacillus fluminis]
MRVNERDGQIEVVKPGTLTTVQDLGRYGYQQYGVPVSGAADSIALRVANLLVGNPESAAGLELTLTGPILRFAADSLICLTGGTVGATLDGNPIDMYKSIIAQAGSTLRVGPIVRGCRAYLAVHGGVDVPHIMGSCSTYLKGKIGGFQGRALSAGDRLAIGSGRNGGETHAKVLKQMANRRLHPSRIPDYPMKKQVHVILGPHIDAFTEESAKRFWAESYAVTTQADRMGLRCHGEPLSHKSGADVISGAVPVGAVQIPADGQPIILLCDRQPTGGYTRIGTVITADLPLVAQARPQDMLHFQPASLQEAHRRLAESERWLRQLRLACLAGRRECL